MKNQIEHVKEINSRLEGQVEMVNIIWTTQNPNIFNKVDTNREVSKNGNLLKEIQKYGIKTPIQVNEKYEIIDGQHRLWCASQILQKGGIVDIPFYIVVGAEQKDMITQNVASKNWKPLDYVQAYRGQNENYQIIHELYEKYRPMSIANLLAVLKNSVTKGSLEQKDNVEFRDGQFEFWNLDYSKEFLKFYDNMVTEIASFNGWEEPKAPKRVFLNSIYEMFAREETDQEHLLYNTPLMYEKYNSETDMYKNLKGITNAYNKGGKSENGETFKRAKREINIEVYETENDKKNVRWVNSTSRIEKLIQQMEIASEMKELEIEVVNEESNVESNVESNEINEEVIESENFEIVEEGMSPEEFQQVLDKIESDANQVRNESEQLSLEDLM